MPIPNRPYSELLDGPNRTVEYADESGTIVRHYRDNKLNSTDGRPAIVEHQLDERGNPWLTVEKYFTDDKLNRVDAPAIIVRGTGKENEGYYREEYYTDDKLDRADGPAIVERHPATVVNGTKLTEGYTREEYYTDGQRRTDGPARILRYDDGRVEESYSVDGELVKEKRSVPPAAKVVTPIRKPRGFKP